MANRYKTPKIILTLVTFPVLGYFLHRPPPLSKFFLLRLVSSHLFLSMSLAASSRSANNNSVNMGSHIRLKWPCFFIPSNPDYPCLSSSHRRSSHSVVKADRGRTVTITKDDLEGESVLCLFHSVVFLSPVCREGLHLLGTEVLFTPPHLTAYL